MFRRKRSSSHAPVNASPSPSAQTAAAQAFRASQNPNAQLSSAAAAAALRKHPTPPTSVQDVQTKRMQRRLSGSSAGSAPGSTQVGPRSGGQSGELRRSRSSGSMTTRSFRGNSPLGADVLIQSDKIDPVPPIPQAYVQPATSTRRGSGLRSPFRSVLPPQKKRTGGRGSSVDREPEMRRVGSPEVPRSNDSVDLEINSSRNSINFSYPMNALPNSPQSPVGGGRMDSRSPTGSNQISPTPASPTRQDSHIERVQRKPISRPKDSLQNEGDHAPGSDKNARSRDVQRHEHEEVQQRNRMADGAHGGKASHSEPGGHVPTPKEAVRAVTDPSNLRGPKRVPSTFREEGEVEDQGRKHGKLSQKEHEDNEGRSRLSHAEKDTSTIPARPQDGMTTNLEEEDAQRAATAQTASLRERGSSPPEPNTLLSAGHLRSSTRTDHSPSPNRSTRFSDRIVVASGDNHLHEPPPKSASAGKSALKRSTSQSRSPEPRPAQPSDALENTSTEKASTTDQSKKANKVSFGAETERHAHIAGSMSSTSSPPSSPRSGPKGFPSDVGRNDAKESVDIGEFDDVLKPRPTLPSFGSVRGRRPFVEDTPTGRSEGDHHRSTGDIRSSNDHAIGGLAAEAVSKDTHHSHPQEDTNLPLPPQVTSVEGSGYDYSSDYTSDSDDEVADWTDIQHPRGGTYTQPPRNRSEPGKEEIHQKEEPVAGSHENPQHPEVVPTISVQPSTPRVEEPNEEPGFSPVPGSFPQQDEEDAQGFPEQEQNVETTGSAAADDKGDDSESDSSDSVYSDAAEDPSELDGDGFGSINAIVDSPVSKIPSFAPASPPDSPTAPRTETRKTDTGSQPAAPSSLRSSSPDFQSVYTTKEREQQQGAESGIHGHTIEHVPAASSDASPEPSSPSSIQPPAQEVGKGTYPIEAQSEPTGNVRQQPLNVEQKSAATQHPHTQQRDTDVRHTRQHTGEYSGFSPVGAGPKGRNADAQAKKHMHDVQAASRGLMQRTLSNGSDSSSSFKRERRSPPRTGRITLRRTLRDGTQMRPFSADNSMNSQPQRQPTSPEGGRSVLRSTLRGPPNGTQGKSSFLPGAGSPKSKGLPGRNLFQGSSQKSDTMEPGQKPFRSRFEDSSDDEVEMTNLRPVRGIPRRRGEVDGDSTELDDSSDSAGERKSFRRQRSNRSARASGPARTASTAATAATHADANKATPAAENSTADIENYLRESRQRKPSLFNRFGRSARIGKLELESAARRDTPLERSRYELRETKGTTPVPAATAPSTTTTTVSGGKSKNPQSLSGKGRPKLQKRVPGRTGSGLWQRQTGAAEGGIPPPVPEENSHSTHPSGGGDTETRRPHTSDGILTNGGHKNDNNSNGYNTSPNHNNDAAGGGGGGGGSASSSPRSKRILPRLRIPGRHEKEDGIPNAGKVPQSPLSDGGGPPNSGGGGGRMGSVVFRTGEKKDRFPLLRKALGLKSKS